ncbi:MAG: phage major capsid protein [Gammaproteobacteria bacterium]
MNSPTPSLLGARLGLTERELSTFNLAELMHHAARQDASKLGQLNEMSRAVKQATGRSVTAPNSWLLPADVLERAHRRDMLASSGTAAYMVGVQQTGFSVSYGAASLLDVLPVQRLNLTGNATMPIGTLSTAGWLSSEGVSEAGTTEPTVAQLGLSPKTCAAVIKYSHQLNAQSPQAAPFVETMLGVALGREVGKALLGGAGSSGAPLTPFGQSGTQTEVGTSWTYDKTLGLIKHAEGFVPGGSVALVASPAAALVLRKTAHSAGVGAADDKLAGHPLVVYGSSPTDRAYCAAWGAVVVATWGSVELTIAPYGAGTGGSTMGDFSRGTIAARILQHIDFGTFAPAYLARSTVDVAA